MSQLNDSFLRQTREALELEAKQNNNEKMPFRGDVSKAIKQRVIVNIDSLAVFSVGVSANKYRSRYRHGGITSSIYRSVKSGGEQVGSLASNITIKGCLSFYESHPLTTSDYAISHLSKVVSPYNVLMADEAYSSLFGKYRNVRLINHSLKAKRKIHTFSRERWSKEGVNSNAVEGANGVLKTAMRQYRWFNCRYSQLYLNEFAVAKNLKFFKMEKNIIFGVNSERDFCGNRIGEIEHKNSKELLNGFLYTPINYSERKYLESSNLKNSLTQDELNKLPKVLQSAIKLNDYSVSYLRGHRLIRERKYRFIYRKVYNYLNKNQWTDLNHVSDAIGITKSECLHIIKKMTLANLLETIVYDEKGRDKVRIKLRYESFYQILLTSEKEELGTIESKFKNKAKFRKEKSNYTGFKRGSKFE
ncbi:hypothetical protein [Leptospira levettii]|uniref:hypothetical protein n=1 Tax=Leptospira levettii TaxID=2023178 RepID=UPI00223DA068|nr:hypothetical protein [Leptospira levettii]MCW7472617.1 transposase [Leptospira levettii]